MAGVDGKLDDILKQVVRRLINEIEELNEFNCYLSLDPDAVDSSIGDTVVVVSPSDGSFDQGMLMGGGELQATIETGIIVKIHSAVMLDEPQREVVFLMDDTHGVLERWRQVLKLLTNWFPTNDDGDEIIRNPLMPAGFTITRSERSIGGIETMFQYSFDLDLTS